MCTQKTAKLNIPEVTDIPGLVFISFGAIEGSWSLVYNAKQIRGNKA